MKYTIYKITNAVNGKTYIGKHQTKDLNDGYMGSGKMLRSALKKYGIENFNKEILHVFDTEEEMNAKEKELVTEEFCLREDTYNICIGGQGGFGYINQNNLNLYGKNGTNGYGAENLREASKRHRARMRWDTQYASDYRASISAGLKAYYAHNGGVGTFRGKKHSEQTRLNMSESRKGTGTGKENSQYGSFWITNGVCNKKIKTVENIPEGWYKGRVIKT